MLRILFFILIFLGALVSTVVYEFVDRKNNAVKHIGWEKFTTFIRSYLFFLFVLYFTISGLKCILGSSQNTIFESFWDIVPGTFVHYGPIMAIVVIVIPLFLRFLCNKRQELISIFVSLELLCLIVIFMTMSAVSNVCYCISFFVCLLITIFFIYLVDKKLEYCSFQKSPFFIKEYGLSIILFPFLVLFYYPNELYLLNVNEFSSEYFSFISILTFSMIGVFFLFVSFLCIIPEKWSDKMVVSIFSLATCCYMQGTFFGNKLRAMEGGIHTWERSLLILNVSIWLAIFAILLIFFCKYKNAIKVMNYISAFLITVLLITSITLLFQNASSIKRVGGEITNNDALVLSSGQNVVVFVLDMTDTAYMEKFFDENPEYMEPLKDFVFYNNVVSRHSQTRYAIPFLLTGTEWRNDSASKYDEYAYDNDNQFIDKLYSEGIELGIYTDVEYIDDSIYYMIPNYQEEVSRHSDIVNTVSTMWRTSMYKTMPLIIKNKYEYYSDQIDEMARIDGKWSINNDVYFYDLLQKHRLTKSDDCTSMFKFYHMRGAHYPYYLSDDVRVDSSYREVSWNTQVKGVMNILYEYINQLKSLGLYDDATIIITTDHGAYNASRSMFDTSIGAMNGPCIPIMFVKLAGEKGERLTVNSAPLSQGDMLATILKIYGIDDYDIFGQAFDEVPEDSDRARYFYDYNENQVISVKVVGDAHDVNNWILE